MAIRNPTHARRYCFTINNPTEEDADGVLALREHKAFKYLIVGNEDEGTPHLQCFVWWTRPIRFNKMKRMLPRAHIEAGRGTAYQAAEYCKKDGDFVEFGDAPIDANQNKKRWDEYKEAAKEGRYDDVPGHAFLSFYRTMKVIHQDYQAQPEPLEECNAHWYVGVAGSGKTHTARTEHPDAFIKDRTKWWDGYAGQDVVIIDDVDLDAVKLGGLFKDWADKYPFKAQVKGAYVSIRPRKLIVTSQYDIEEIWADDKTRAALNRRFTVKRFLALKRTMRIGGPSLVSAQDYQSIFD